MEAIQADAAPTVHEILMERANPVVEEPVVEEPAES